jgi:hypothetical protein
MKSGWIQVGTQKPKEGQRVIGYDADFVESAICIFVYRKGDWCYPNEEHFKGCRVTHWMPIPDKPSKI